MLKIKLLAGVGAICLIFLIAKLSIAEGNYQDMEIQPVAHPQTVTVTTLQTDEDFEYRPTVF